METRVDQDWPTGFRDIQVQMSSPIRPKVKFDGAFMPVLVTSNFDDDSIKNERASMETPFSHYKSMGIF